MIATITIENAGPIAGPVTLTLNPVGTTEIRGASQAGKSTVAALALLVSLLFRDALRRAVSMPWCPIVVDDAQSLAGAEYPAVSGPVIVLRGGEGALEVA